MTRSQGSDLDYTEKETEARESALDYVRPGEEKEELTSNNNGGV